MSRGLELGGTGMDTVVREVKYVRTHLGATTSSPGSALRPVLYAMTGNEGGKKGLIQYKRVVTVEVDLRKTAT